MSQQKLLTIPVIKFLYYCSTNKKRKHKPLIRKMTEQEIQLCNQQLIQHGIKR